MLSALRRNKWEDHINRIFALSGISMPEFWLGLVALMIFYQWLGWFPGGGVM